jgi:hypothetical protein
MLERDQGGGAVFMILIPNTCSMTIRGEVERGLIRHQQATTTYQRAADRQHLLFPTLAEQVLMSLAGRGAKSYRQADNAQFSVKKSLLMIAWHEGNVFQKFL